MSIPKIVHYCWFGDNEKNELVHKCIESWKLLLPDFEIREWNEESFDLKTAPKYVRDAYKSKKWAFVADYVRLYALYTYGGVYFDTDVEVIKSFGDILNDHMFIGAESKYSICTAVIGAEPCHELIKLMMYQYSQIEFLDKSGKQNLKPNTQLLYEVIVSKYSYKSSDVIQRYSNLTVYPQDYFSPINSYTLVKRVTENTMTIHWFDSSWKDWKYKSKMKAMAFATRIVGEDCRQYLKEKKKSLK